VVDAVGMNLEWIQTSIDLAAAIADERWFTALDLSKELHEELEEFTHALLVARERWP